MGIASKKTSAPSAPALDEYIIKVLVVGHTFVGKSAVIRRFVKNEFSVKPVATLGVDFHVKVLRFPGRKEATLRIWDIQGQERFGPLTRVYYKQATGAVVVVDVTERSTWQIALKWKAGIEECVFLPDGKPIPIFLMANKVDLLPDPSFEKDLLDAFCAEHGFAGWTFTSAKENKNIEAGFRALTSMVIERLQALPDDYAEQQEAERKNSILLHETEQPFAKALLMKVKCCFGGSPTEDD